MQPPAARPVPAVRLRPTWAESGAGVSERGSAAAEPSLEAPLEAGEQEGGRSDCVHALVALRLLCYCMTAATVAATAARCFCHRRSLLLPGLAPLPGQAEFCVSSDHCTLSTDKKREKVVMIIIRLGWGLRAMQSSAWTGAGGAAGAGGTSALHPNAPSLGSQRMLTDPARC